MFRCYTLAVFSLIPALAYGLEWDEFQLFYRDHQGAVLMMLSDDGQADEKYDGQGYVIDVSIKKPLLAYYVSKSNVSKSKPDRKSPSFKTATCELSIFHDPYLKCAKSTGPFSGAYFKGTLHERVEQPDPKLPQDVGRLFRDYLGIMEYGALGISFRCATGCAANTPRLILLVWHGD